MMDNDEEIANDVINSDEENMNHVAIGDN